MYHRTSVMYVSAVVIATLGLTACIDNPLDVQNTNNPDVSRVYSSPANVETTVSQLFKNLYNGQYGSADDIWTQTLSMSFESHSQLGNFGMGTRAAIPRNPIDNSIGNVVSVGNFRDFDFLSRNAKSAANTIAAVNGFNAKSLSIGSPARDARAKSFAFFALGYALGNLAMIYDSAAIITPAQASDFIPPMSDSKTVGAAALADLDSALAIANSANATNGTNGWPIPTDWMSTTATIDKPTWIRIVRSYKAKIRAGVPRTPADRAAISWTSVIDDATNGITADFNVNANTTTGWSSSIISQLRVSTGWSQMTPFILGMADSTGGYDAWLATPLTQRGPFLMKTLDKRFPSGETRAAQTAVTGSVKGGPAAGSILYFRNRPSGEDTPAEPWGTWYYDNWRFWGITANGGNGPFTVFTVVENDMLAAEGYLRTGNIPAAAALIDKSRVRAGLPGVTGMT
ncbi:MAG TPA: hypothetical protein VKO87_05270, partial [Gemmatimonadaceae bacterium]|nr:hypothetical protein [Gemmatimonadaceae bacterium]